MTNPIITVVRDPQHTLGKSVFLNLDGTITKKSNVSVAFGVAIMHRIESLDELAKLLQVVGEDPHAAIINASFNGIDVGEEFVILSEREIEARLGIACSDRERQKGLHQIERDGKPYKAIGRFKQNVRPSSWQYFDRDIDESTPKQFAEMSIEQWVSAIEKILPGVGAVSRCHVASTSSRVHRDGVAVGNGNGHMWVKIRDPDDVERLRTVILIYAAKAEMTWLKPRLSRLEPGKVVGHSLTTIIDPSVFTPGRLVFVGKPVVSGGLTVSPLSATVHMASNEFLDSSTIVLPSQAAIREITRKAGIEMDVQRDLNNLRITAHDLTLDTELDLEDGSTITVRDLQARGERGKVRCQTPFRSSSSFAAFYSCGADRNPFVFDVGTGITHWLRNTESDAFLIALAAIQQQFSLINMAGKLWVLEQGTLAARTVDGLAKKLVLSNRSDGTLLIARALKAQFPSVESSLLLKEFFVSPATVCYEGVDFDPSGSTGNQLNLWVGPTVAPRAGNWTLIHSFLRDVLCDGNEVCFKYLLGYIAHALQRPWEKPGILIILLGGQGTGKGTFGRILRLIWSATYLQVHNIDAVTGSFNAALERAYIVFMDEALFAGDRKASDALKSLVTEPVIHINEKHQPARQTHSYHRFIAATNADHLKNTDRDDRRDFALRVSEARKGDHAYWQALNHEVNNGGVEAMVHDLLAQDLSDFNVRLKPDTPELLAQKLLSLGAIPRWWHDCLSDGAFTCEGAWPDFISTDAAIKGVVEMAGGRLYQKPSPSDLVQALLKLCPSARQKQKQETLGRHRGLLLPDLQQARAEFEQYVGGAVSWEKAAAADDNPSGPSPTECEF